MHEDSTAENPESKLYAFEAGRRAVQAHYERTGIHAEVFKGEYLGLYRTKFIRDHDPLISIIIPNKDHIDDLKRCMESIEQKSTYKNYEYIIVENNSTDSATFEYYKKLEQRIRRSAWYTGTESLTILPLIIMVHLLQRVSICFCLTMIQRSLIRTVWKTPGLLHA